MNQKGFIPLALVIIGALLGAAVTLAVVEYKDEITASISKIFKGPEIEILDEEAIDSVEEEEITEPEEEEVIEEVEEPARSSDVSGSAQPEGDELKPAPAPAPEPEPEPEPEVSVCGNGTCEEAENCYNCSVDCGCGAEETCVSGQCIEPECTSDTNCDDENQYTEDICVANICYNPCLVGQTCDDDDNLTINDMYFSWVSGCICKGTPVECFNNSDCDDDDSSTVDICNNAGTEDADCSNTVQTACTNNADCSSDPCVVYWCENAGTVDAACILETTITGCFDDDYGCCPSGCGFATDPDCQ